MGLLISRSSVGIHIQPQKVCRCFHVVVYFWLNKGEKLWDITCRAASK